VEEIKNIPLTPFKEINNIPLTPFKGGIMGETASKGIMEKPLRMG
jgi:hypothetical protein